MKAPQVLMYQDFFQDCLDKSLGYDDYKELGKALP